MKLTNEEIKILQNNTTPLGLLGDRYQKIIQQAEEADLLVFISNHNGPYWTKPGALLSNKDHRNLLSAYKLRPDYEPPVESELVYCEIDWTDSGGFFMHPKMDRLGIDVAVRHKDFVGGIYDEKVVYGSIAPIPKQALIDGDGVVRLFWDSKLDLDSESFLMEDLIYPTHVVLRRGK